VVSEYQAKAKAGEIVSNGEIWAEINKRLDQNEITFDQAVDGEILYRTWAEYNRQLAAFKIGQQVGKELEASVVTLVGRPDRGSDVQTGSSQMGVSKVHLGVVEVDGKLYVSNLSNQGVTQNGQAIDQFGVVEVDAGDEIVLGLMTSSVRIVSQDGKIELAKFERKKAKKDQPDAVLDVDNQALKERFDQAFENLEQKLVKYQPAGKDEA